MEARAQLGIAGSGLYPQLQQLTRSGVAGRAETSPTGPTTSFGSYGAAFDIAWEMDFWGKYRRGIEAADASYFASIAQYDDVQVLVAAQAASLYTSIRTFEQRLRIAHENAALQKRSLEITERLFASGNESELDVQQAKSLYLGTIATIPELESALRQAQNALNVLLGRPPGPMPEMAAGREQIPEAGLDVIVDMPAELLRRRPDVRTAEMQLAAQSALIGVSEAALYPSIALVGTVGLSATSLASSSTTLDWSAGPALVVERVRLRPAAEPGAGAGRPFPATVRGVPGHRPAGGPRTGRCRGLLCQEPRSRSASWSRPRRRRSARSTSRRSSTRKDSSTSSACSTRSARCSASRNAS